MKRLEISVCLGLVFAVLLSIASLNTECSEIRDSVLRLHVLANSDSAEDQALKMKVRDRILSVSERKKQSKMQGTTSLCFRRRRRR